MKTSRLLIILPNDNLGGAEQYLKMIAKYYSQKKYYIDVYFLKKELSGGWNDLQSPNFSLNFTTQHTEKKGVIPLFSKLFRNRKEQYEYTFTSHVHINAFVGLLRKANIIKTKYHIARESTSIFSRYSGLKLIRFKLFYEFGYKGIDLLICQTHFMYDQLVMGMPKLTKKTKVVVIPNPIDKKLQCVTSNEDLKSAEPFIISAGRLIHEKGFDVLIDSFYLLQQKINDLTLVILGEGELRNELERKIHYLNLADKIFMPGFVEDVHPYFKNASLCVVSSRIEGFPNVLLQMMAQNTKVVSTLCAGGIAELQGIETCPPDEVESLYYAMLQIIQRNTSENRRLFDKELKERSIGNFIMKIEEYLQI